MIPSFNSKAPPCLINTAPPSSSALQLLMVPPFITKVQPLPISTAPPSSPALQSMMAPPFIMNLPYLIGVSVTPVFATSTAPPSPSASVQFTILPLSKVSVSPLTSIPQFLFCPSILPPMPLSFTVRFPLLRTRIIFSSVELQLSVYPFRSRVTVRSTSSSQTVSMFSPNLTSVQSAFSNAASSSESFLTDKFTANTETDIGDSTMHNVSRTVNSLVFMFVFCICLLLSVTVNYLVYQCNHTTIKA
ncbi:unknown [Ruminococcus sp. CAG:488]|nr:unknown [Ruminococcus sp. CAG:488]